MVAFLSQSTRVRNRVQREDLMRIQDTNQIVKKSKLEAQPVDSPNGGGLLTGNGQRLGRNAVQLLQNRGVQAGLIAVGLGLAASLFFGSMKRRRTPTLFRL